jgi:hypothetical protein
MSDKKTDDKEPEDVQPKAVKLPQQTSAQDTSNWDNREFTTPTDRIVFETFHSEEDGTVVAE